MLWGVLIRWRSGHRYTHRDDPGRTRAADGHLHAQERGLGDPACLAFSPRDCETAASAGSAAGAVTGPRGPQGGQGTSHPCSPRPQHNTLPPSIRAGPGRMWTTGRAGHEPSLLPSSTTQHAAPPASELARDAQALASSEMERFTESPLFPAAEHS